MPHIHGQGIYLPFDIAHISQPELGAIEAAKGTGVIGAAAGQREKIALPLAGRTENIGPFKLLRFLSSLHKLSSGI